MSDAEQALSSLTVRQALKKYNERISVNKRGSKQEKYRASTISKTFIGKLSLSQVTTVNVADYRDMRLASISPTTNRPVSPNTVRLELALLSDLFNIAIVEWGSCTDNPVSRVRKPKIPPGRDRRITWGEERRILRAASKHGNHEIYSIVVLALETAMRQGEILSLQWENIDLRLRIAHLPITKNGSKRDVPLSLRAVDALTRLGVGTQGPVFKYTSDGFKSAWRAMIKRLGIQDLHFHDLRHEAVSRLFELGTLDMMEVATISGHKSMQMLKRYTHLKASNLVAKLDGKKTLNKGKQVISQTIVPYPAALSEEEGEVTLQFMDFEHLRLQGNDLEDVAARARDALLRELVNLVRLSKKAPVPTPPLEYVDNAHVVLIDPL
ncbi:site-specific integrase [Burkholderia ubonensis]|uniref:site-specific integrase n=1 Tax=Burkholderia ubonensis TaxID=101571 RepID=UPI00075415DD|nr:site-specific integrase [Burkholderia ubonensis]KVO15206.1 DNA recombinase [Burkholderia ubonensis]KVT01203.1 DNA recombinase [Burkholderia ubonensis]KVT07496.1 DNA recombinase [Burkholderia ubonensis]KVT33863.1 DNA recombinase [Burkholderia ubonensis]